jgi:FkbM family methyltransferase
MSKMSLASKLVRLPLKLIPPSLKVPFLYGSLRGFKWITGASNHGYWLGFYERKMKKYLIENLHKGEVMLDLGAHVGYYSLIGARLVGSEGKVYAFEPLPRNIGYLRQHLKLNDVRNVQLFEGAIAHYEGVANFNDASFVGARFSETGKVSVKVYWLRKMIEEKILPIPNVIKMDIEGAEVDLIPDIISILKNNQIKIFLSTHGKAIHQQCIANLSAIGYQFIPLDGENLEKCTEMYAYRN